MNTFYTAYTLCSAEEYSISITAPPNPVAGEQCVLTCTVDVGEGTSTLQWIGPGVMNGTATAGNQTQSDTTFTLTLTFSILNTSHGGEYTCQSSVGGVNRTAVTALSVQSKLRGLSVVYFGIVVVV